MQFEWKFQVLGTKVTLFMKEFYTGAIIGLIHISGEMVL